MMDKPNDQRHYPRVLVHVLVDYESTNTLLYDYSNDLSEGGIFIETDQLLENGTEVTLRFTLPGVDRVFEVKGDVAWLNHSDQREKRPAPHLPVGMGIQFGSMDDKDRALLREYVTKVLDGTNT